MNFFAQRCNHCIIAWNRAAKRQKILIFIGTYTVLFLLTFVLAYQPFLSAEKTFILAGDGRRQHYPALVYLGRYLRKFFIDLLHGNFSLPLFDMNIGLGEDIISTLNWYGLGDPLDLLAAFVPTKNIEQLYNFLVIFRTYIAGLTFSWLCVYHKKHTWAALIGSLIYTYSGYAIFDAVRHPFFINPMIQLPLLLIGIDLVIKKKKSMLFAVSVFYAAICGFYFLYMMTIIIGIYALAKFFEYYRTNRIRMFMQTFGRIIGNYLWGIGMASVLFIPAVLGYLSSSRIGHKNIYFFPRNTYWNMLLEMFAPPGSWEALSCAAIGLFALVLIFSVKGKQYKRLKIWFIIGMAVYWTPIGAYIMNGFSYPSYRWTFGLALLLAYMVVEMLPALLNLDRKQKWLCLMSLLVYIFLVIVRPQNRSVYHMTGIAMLALTLVILFFINDKGIQGDRKQQLVGILACILLTIGNISINAIYRFAEEQKNYVGQFTKIGVETEQLEGAVEREAEPFLSDRLGRFDSMSFLNGRGMVWHVPTLFSYWSISNGYATDLWNATENIGLRENYFDLKGLDQRTIMGTLLSTRYFIGEESNAQYLPYGYRLAQETPTGHHIYENEYALPWGYTYDSFLSYADLEGMNGLNVEEAMLQSIVIDNEVEGIQKGYIESNILSVPYEIVGQQDLTWENGILNISKANAVLSLEMQMPELTEGYLRLQGYDINGMGQTNFNVAVNCEKVNKAVAATSETYSWYFGREDYVVNLGYSEEGRTACTIKFPKAGICRLDDIQIFARPMDDYRNQVNRLRAEPLENIHFEANRITGMVDLSSDKILCMSVPFSTGWSAKVDGEPMEILRANIMFMGLPLTEGHHEIEFVYCTPGLKLGAVISCISFAGAIIGNKRKRLQKRSKTNKS